MSEKFSSGTINSETNKQTNKQANKQTTCCFVVGADVFNMLLGVVAVLVVVDMFPLTCCLVLLLVVVLLTCCLVL